MKVLLIIVLVAIAAVAHANECNDQDDASSCSVTCTSPEVKACEHHICTCAPSCHMTSDCNKQCQEMHTPDGHVMHQEVVCMDGACICEPSHHQGPPPGGDHHHQPPQ